MGNDVFANNMEISCKAASGKAICAFPDVCFTPPQTPATPPGVPIPYPNTGMASDCTDGSRTVKISGQEVMLKNKSYFKRSTGDEAGCAPKKGVLTSKNMGKVFFTMWSMDVKAEGENVVRHFDLSTHNHGSTSNTGPWLYTDTVGMQVGGVKDPCKAVREEAETQCRQHIDDNTYKKGARQGEVNETGAKEAMCSDKKCKEALKCVLSPFSFGCCPGKPKKTPHHVVPVHCFMPAGQREAEAKDSTIKKKRYKGCKKYDAEAAPCVCAHGKGKKPTGKQHGRLHKHFDPIEDSHKEINGGDGTWSYNEAATAGTESVKMVFPECDSNCIRAQLNKYHTKDASIPPGTKLRADSSGQAAPAASLKVVIKSGAAS